MKGIKVLTLDGEKELYGFKVEVNRSPVSKSIYYSVLGQTYGQWNTIHMVLTKEGHSTWNMEEALDFTEKANKMINEQQIEEEDEEETKARWISKYL